MSTHSPEEDGALREVENVLVISSGRGRPALPLSFAISRELTLEDMQTLAGAEATGAGMPAVKALRHTHHLLAKAIASGKTMGECAQLTGYTASRISVLKQDPAFVELVTQYSDEVHEIFVDVHKRMAVLGIATLEELQARFDEAPEKFSRKELMDMFALLADRSIPSAKGGPAQQQTSGGGINLQVNFVTPPQIQEPGTTIEAKASLKPTLTISPSPELEGDADGPEI